MRLFSVGPKSLRSLDAYCVGSALPGNLLFPSVTCCFTKQETDRRGTGNLYTWIERTVSVPGQYPFASRRTDELGWKVPVGARESRHGSARSTGACRFCRLSRAKANVSGGVPGAAWAGCRFRMARPKNIPLRFGHRIAGF